MVDRGIRHWLPAYFKQQLSPREKPDAGRPVHVILCKVDHYEPFNGGADAARAQERVKTWVERYPRMAGTHRDADGRMPQHTWFYPPHLEHRFLSDLTGLCRKGCGEIEMHLHHNHMAPFPDTEETLRAKIMKCVDDYSRHGIFCLPDGTRRFAFIHGDWSLANSRGEKYCGVNDEIRILKECGCYADFTFPSLGAAQPATVNRIYYCTGDPARPKSYNRGRPLTAGGSPAGDLLMIPGILGLRWNSRTHSLKPALEASNLGGADAPTPGRVDYWVKHAVSIEGRPEWKFIKLHTHGARESSWDALVGDAGDAMHTHLETRYNDGKRYVLHYVTAREMYNIIKAAEAGKEGDPSLYRDFEIPRYVYLGENRSS